MAKLSSKSKTQKALVVFPVCSVILQLITAAFLTAFLFFLFAKIMCVTDIAQKRLFPVATAIGSAALFIVNLLFRKNTILLSISVSLLCWLVLCVIGIITGGKFSFLTVLKGIAFVNAGLIGTILAEWLASRKRSTPPKRPRRV